MTDCRRTCIPAYMYVLIVSQNMTCMHAHILAWGHMEQLKVLNGVVLRKAWEPPAFFDACNPKYSSSLLAQEILLCVIATIIALYFFKYKLKIYDKKKV